MEVERAEQQLIILREKILSAQVLLARITQRPVGEIPTRTTFEFHRWLSKAYPSYETAPASSSTGSGRRRRRASRDGIPRATRRAISQLSALVEKKGQITGHLEANRSKAGLDGGISGVLAKELPAVLSEISEEVTLDFINMANLSHIKAISIHPSPDKHALEISCSLPSGKEVDPTQVLREGALDLLALLILLGVANACARRGQARFLVLDDVWQSVDAVHREAILNHLFVSRFKDWQLLITVHDRLWARLIEDRARRSNFNLKAIELVRWTPTEGPHIRTPTLNIAARLKTLIDEGEPEVIGSYAGRFLEQLADELSQEMRTSLSRAPGDRYDLGALWPGIFSALNKSDIPQESKDMAKAVEDTIVLRNLYSAHYQHWAESLTSSEIRRFAMRIVDLWNATHCSICWRPLTLSVTGNNRTIAFPCSHSATGMSANN